MKFVRTSIPEVVVIEPVIHGDHRGYFMETWREEWLGEIGQNVKFVQDNQSKSRHGTLRGLHYQVKHAQGKYIRVLDGEIFDAVVDLRKSSATFGQWVGVTLSSDNKKSLWVPAGFAHGFLVLSESAEITYKCTDYYAREYERSLLWNDQEIGIKWPTISGDLLLSDKDSNATPLSKCELYP